MSETQKTIVTTEDHTFPVWPLCPVGDGFDYAQGHAADGDKHADDLICVCGNSAPDDGFIYCSRDGKQFEPTPGDWDGLDIDGSTVMCISCRRVLETTPVANHKWDARDAEYFGEFLDSAWDLDDKDLVAVRVLGTVANPSLPSRLGWSFDNRPIIAVAYALSDEGFDPLVIDHGMGNQVVYVPNFFSDGVGIDIDNANSAEGQIDISKCDYVNTDGSTGPLNPKRATLDMDTHDFGDGVWESHTSAAKYPHEIVALIKTAKSNDTLPPAIETN